MKSIEEDSVVIWNWEDAKVTAERAGLKIWKEGLILCVGKLVIGETKPCCLFTTNNSYVLKAFVEGFENGLKDKNTKYHFSLDK